MTRCLRFDTGSGLLEFLLNGFVRSARSDVFSPGILHEKKRPALSRMVSGCANAGGGNYFIGGRTKGRKFAGTDPVAESDGRFLKDIILDHVFPEITGLTVTFYPLEGHNGKGILHLFIPDSHDKPFMASDNRYYMRHGLRELLMEEHQVRTLYRSVAAADLELAALMNTNGIPEYNEGVLAEIRFYPKFLIRNNGNAPASLYKFEIHIPTVLHDPGFTALQNYFNRLEGVHSVFSFPSRSTIFQSERFTVAEAKLSLCREHLPDFMKQDILINLFTEQGVKPYVFRLHETFTLDKRPVSNDMFTPLKKQLK
jgi:hypothetical protein